MSIDNYWQPTVPPTSHGCISWVESTQLAVNLYRDGARLWTKEMLHDIEQQLISSEHSITFTVRRLDGSIFEISNPMFGEMSPIWKPYVKYKEYWRHVQSRPDGPPEAYLCSYLIDWKCHPPLDMRLENPGPVFEQAKLRWYQTESHQNLVSWLMLHPRLKSISKVLCFGLGEFCRAPSEWMQTDMNETHVQDKLLARGMQSIIQHSIALTIAKECGAGERRIPLLAQDTDYTQSSAQVLEAQGFSIVGHAGAGGFAEVNDSSVVFTGYPSLPIKQIIADIARPELIISLGFSASYDPERPIADPESPRTMKMWEEYESYIFPISPNDLELTGETEKLPRLQMYVKRNGQVL